MKSSTESHRQDIKMKNYNKISAIMHAEIEMARKPKSMPIITQNYEMVATEQDLPRDDLQEGDEQIDDQTESQIYLEAENSVLSAEGS